MDFGFSVQDLLSSKYLRYITRIVAGEKGLSKTVSWVHILEIRDIIKECVNGNELVLTTGIGFTKKDIAVSFLQELIDKNVAALCIETPLYYNKIDQELIDLANANNFPLIEITEISRFIDITKGLNTMIINNEAELYHDADRFDNQLDEVNSKGTLADGIRYTADYLDIEVAYLPVQGRHYGVTPDIKALVDSKLALLDKTFFDNEIYVRGNLAIKQLKLLEEPSGYLVFNSSKRNLTQFDTLILGRLSNKIEHDILIEHLKNEEKLYKSNDWIKDWLDGILSETEVKNQLKNNGYFRNFSEFLVCCTKFCCMTLKIDSLSYSNKETNNKKLFNEFLVHTTIIRNVFEKEGFSVLGFIDDEMISYIIMNPHGLDNTFERLEQSVQRLRLHRNQFIDYKNSMFTIGKKVSRYSEVMKSYQTAVETLKTMEMNCGDTIFYDHLYINRMLNKLNSQHALNEFITDHLGELLEPCNMELLHTLKTYYECNCSKQKTAEKLFIVRQTLYFRLQKIEDILGNDYSEGEKRFALEFAVRAYFYLNHRERSIVTKC